MMALKVRELQAGDIKTVARVLGKNSEKLMGVYSKASALPDEQKSEELGKQMAIFIVTHCLDDIWSWLASMAEVTPEELDKMPLSTPKDIVMAIYKSDQFADFFGELQLLWAKAEKASQTA